eukprot:symbB.v1.2.016786.t1/scaffold1290.1/size126440/7
MSQTDPSEVMPFGAATDVMASRVRPGKSTRPRDTARPLARALGVEVQMPCDKVDARCFAEHVTAILSSGSTVAVFWQHEDIPKLVEALHVPDHEKHLKPWPKICPSSFFREPACVRGSMCYDEIWQVTMERTAQSDTLWHATSMRSWHQGFSGRSRGKCNSGLEPNVQSILA